MESIRNTVTYNLESTISAMEALAANPKAISSMHPVRNIPRWTEMMEQLELMRAELNMLTWKQLFSVPEHCIVITVPEYATARYAHIALLEKYLCANSKLDECVRLDPVTLQPEKLYTFTVPDLAPPTTFTTFTISHKNHEPQLTIFTESNYHRIPADSDDWQTTITYYCSFIDEELEFLKDDLMMESEVSTNDCN